ncbi:MAG: hypothetical protein F6K22_03550 [Okeania sp. SIO2F4]|uniref:hypothetical protein n=1 Tax=Okeania sp. SIO2F4 TaxID=2607790 RepID=UPI00142BCC0A|nr:hypothetical protein [Okeania sp. SIO2F4]MDJ0517380.1 hypothetical protein [Trichodesmium sp. MO_231.B1]NES01981.1 hypothetical protein [Okeania sp. SIO2F4]
MSEKPVFKINQKLFNQLNNWQEKMEAKEKNEAEAEIDVNNQDKKLIDSQKEKD